MKTILHIILSALLILTTSCVKKVPHNQIIEAEIWDCVDSGDTIIDFEEIVSFEWDSMIILPPYTYLDRLGDSLDFNFKPVKYSGIEYLDHFCLLIFVHNEEIISMAEVELSIEPEIAFIDRNDSKFSVGREVNKEDMEKPFVYLKRSTTPNTR